MIDANKKPIFEYSDSDIKSLAYDILEQIEYLQKDLSLLRMELSRRRSSNVVTSTSDKDLSKMFDKNNSDATVVLPDDQDLLTPT
jgi:hypothetical protein